MALHVHSYQIGLFINSSNAGPECVLYHCPGIIAVALYHDKYTILRVLRQPL